MGTRDPKNLRPWETDVAMAESERRTGAGGKPASQRERRSAGIVLAVIAVGLFAFALWGLISRAAS